MYQNFREWALGASRLAYNGQIPPHMQAAWDQADGSIFFQRQLEAIDARIFEKRFAPLRARDFLPVKNDAGWATFEVYQIVEEYGIAHMVSDNATDVATVNLDGREVSQRVQMLASAYDYNIREVNRARELNLDLDARKAIIAFRAMERKIDEIGAIGAAEGSLQGFLNNSAITPTTVPNGAAASPLWVNKTPDEILLDVSDAINDMRTNSNADHEANLVLFDLPSWGILQTTPRSSTSDLTILEYLRRVHPMVTFDWWHRLTGAGAGGTARMVVCDRDPDNFELSIPVEAMRLDPQFHALSTKVVMVGLCGGLLLRRPLAVIYRDGM